jgi:hypothetical protein
MNHRKAYLVLTGIILLMLTVTIIVKSSQDPKATIKHQRREARYGAAYDRSRVKANLSEEKVNNVFNMTFIDYVETKDLNDVAVRSTLRNTDTANRQKLACEADLVMRGQVVKAEGVITDDDHFVYTVYTILVNDAFRTAKGVEVKAGDTIEMTGPGGIINIDANNRLLFYYPALLALTVENEYIFLLKYDSEAGDFYYINPWGLYEADGSRLRRMDAMMDSHLESRARAASVPNTLDQFKAEINQITCGR